MTKRTTLITKNALPTDEISIDLTQNQYRKEMDVLQSDAKVPLHIKWQNDS